MEITHCPTVSQPPASRAKLIWSTIAKLSVVLGIPSLSFALFFGQATKWATTFSKSIETGRQTIRNEEQVYTLAVEEEEENAYKIYQLVYSDGEYKQDVIGSLRKLTDEDEAYRNATNSNTVASYESYLTKYPNGRFAYAARLDRNE